MGSTIKKAALAIFGALILIWGINTVDSGIEGPGNITVISGKVKMLSGAYDAQFDVRVDSPMLVRRVEMYQREFINGVLSEDWFDYHVELSLSDMEKYNEGQVFGRIRQNPAFPKELGAKTLFVGDATLGDSGLVLSEQLLEKFSYDSYLYFDSTPGMLTVSGMTGCDPVGEYKPLDDITYGIGGGRYPEVGDVRITWTCLNMNNLAPAYTAAGEVSDGVIGVGTDVVPFIFDKVMTYDEVVEFINNSQTKTGTWLIIVGAAMLAAPIVVTAVQKKKSGRKD